MSLIKSISGIRGTIGGIEKDGLNPLSISRFVVAFAEVIRKETKVSRPLIVVGRDARLSGTMVLHIVKGTLLAVGCDIMDIGLATTPTTEIAVTETKAQGGIIITASHNPKHWNALKLLNNLGEFFSAEAGEAVIKLSENLEEYPYATVENLGKELASEDFLQVHIEKILVLPEVDTQAIRNAHFKVAFDAINSVGGIALPRLLNALGVSEVVSVNSEPNGNFAHNPEPLPKHLGDLSQLVLKEQACIGIAVDPDVDRLALYDEKGKPFGEEYTLVAVADYMLSLHGEGNSTVSNLSSTRALKMITEEKHRGHYAAAAVGEVNVVKKMKEVKALVGGEGNGGVILPSLHYGRDALVGIALFLSFLAKKGCTVSTLRTHYPQLQMCKERVDLPEDLTFATLKPSLLSLCKEAEKNLEDGIKYDFPDYWIHIRPSNTEPIIRIYTEAATEEKALEVAQEMKKQILSLIKQ